MSSQYQLDFGKHKGKTLNVVKDEDPNYILWLSGVKQKDSFKAENIKIYADVLATHSDAVEAAHAFLKNKCTKCWEQRETGHFCKGMQTGRNYHYHPYGKRDF